MCIPKDAVLFWNRNVLITIPLTYLDKNEKVFANTPTNKKGNKIFYTLFAQRVSTLTCVLFGCSFTTET
jgi:hypothetical protein